MLDAIIAGLIVAFITVLAWLAYNHYEFYDKIYTRITYISLAVFSSFVFYNLGKFDATTDKLNFPLTETIVKATIIYLSFMAYIILLAALPAMIKKQKEQKPK